MKQNIIMRIIALAIIVLVIGMPVYAVNPNGIISYKISGQDGVNKVVRQNDYLDVEAVVAVDGDDKVTKDQVWLGSTIQFDSCAPDINGYKCSLRFPASGMREFASREPFYIGLYDDTHGSPPTSYSLVDDVSGFMVNDLYPPRISFSIDRSKFADTITVDYDAYDDSTKRNYYDECAGLRTIEFYTPGREINEVIDYDEANVCHDDSEYEIDVSDTPEGSYVLTAKAVDYLGNEAFTNLSIEVDRTGARFSNIKILDDYDNDVYYVADKFLDATVVAEVSSDADISTVRADLSSLNDIEDYSDIPGICGNEDDKIVCRWDIRISPRVYGQHNLVFKAEDIIGNYNEDTFVRGIQKDDEGPRPVDIRTSLRGSNNINYLRQTNNSIEAIFSESGSGLNKDDVFMDMSSLGLGNKVSADRCEQGWKCYWDNLNFNKSDGNYTISIHPDTKDIAGNKIREFFSSTVIMDTSKPAIIEVSVEPIEGSLNLYEGLMTKGDVLEIKARLFEPGTISVAYGDFSSIINGAGSVLADDCFADEDGIWECTWITDPIDISGYIDTEIELSFKDFLGNVAYYNHPIKVYGIDNSLTDYWTHSVECSPSKVDREVTSIIEQRIYCSVNLIGRANTVSINLGKCTGDNSTRYVRKTELLNSQQGSENPYIKITLYESDVLENRINMNCPLLITSQSGNTVTGIPELENVSISIPMFNNPLGEYGDNLEERAKSAREDATGGIWETITSLRKILFYAERICSLITTINNIAGLFNSISLIKDSFAKSILPVNPPAAEGVDQSRQADQSVSSYLNSKMKKAWIGGEKGIGGGENGKGIVNKFCKFISCRLFYDEIWDEGIMQDLGNWQRGVLDFSNDVATGWGGFEVLGVGGKGVNAYTTTKNTDERGGVSAKINLEGGKLNPKDSLVLSFATLCIPGIIYNLDKYRQIQCMYADCLQTSVDTGVPIYACEDAKEYQTCKYVYGELFQLLPFTGLLDYFSGLVKGALSSPFGFIDIALGYMCQTPVTTPFAGKIANICLYKEVAGMIADIWSDLANIQDDWKIKTDYCSRLKEDDGEDSGGSSGGSFGGLF